MHQIEGVGGGAGEGVLIQDLFGQGADQGLAAEAYAIGLAGLLEDVLDMQGATGLDEYVIDDLDVRFTCRTRPRPGRSLPRAQGAQGAELSLGRFFEDIEEILARQGWSMRQRSEQTATFSRDLRKFLVGGLLDLVTDREMKPIKGRRLHLVEFLAQMPGGIIDLPILKSPQGDL